MFALAPHLDNLLKSLPPKPITKEQLDEAVSNILAESKESISADNRKAQWEYLLRAEVFKLAATEGNIQSASEEIYYSDLRDRLDIILTFTERDACEQTFPFTVLQDLLETQTIASCSHIFSWIEERSARLTEGLVPQKGKALVLLRTLNDLLRRLSKTGGTTMFCGRILTFLSGVFPLGERSGVNLRGEYGPQWEAVLYTKDEKSDSMEVDEPSQEPQESPAKEDAMDTSTSEAPADKKDAKAIPTKPAADKTEEEKKRDFFYTFWSLQLPFSRPPVFSQPETFANFKTAVGAVIPVIKEATVKERAMMGSKAVVGSKRKRETTPLNPTDESMRNYFFAKFLTSPELLDLEIADTHFRRQFLFQLLILLSHLLQFTKAEKAKWVTPRNRSLQMDFTLEPADAKWVQETMTKVTEELRQTTPNGRAFAETVQAILEREKNWVRWKNNLCSPFDKEALSVPLEESTLSLRKKMREDPEEWKHKLGSEALTEIWQMGYRDLMDLQHPFDPGEMKDFLKEIEKEDKKIALQKQRLAKAAQARARLAASKAASASTSTVPTPAPVPAANIAPQPTPVLITSPVPTTPARVSTPNATSPLHPSLPPKPGTTSIVLSESKPTTPVANPTPAAVPAPLANVNANPSRAVTPAPTAVVVTPPEVTDPVILKLEENKHRISWLALRAGREKYLHLFPRIEKADQYLPTLVTEIDKEREQERKLEEDKGLSATEAIERSASPSASNSDTKMTTAESELKEEFVKEELASTSAAVDEDIKMESPHPSNEETVK